MLFNGVNLDILTLESMGTDSCLETASKQRCRLKQLQFLVLWHWLHFSAAEVVPVYSCRLIHLRIIHLRTVKSKVRGVAALTDRCVGTGSGSLTSSNWGHSTGIMCQIIWCQIIWPTVWYMIISGSRSQSLTLLWLLDVFVRFFDLKIL